MAQVKKYDIFICYRREGGDFTAKMIRDALCEKGYSVFYDIDSLRNGIFNTKILEVIENCTDVLVVLSKGSLDRTENEDDWVRREIAHALKHGKNVVPLLMRGFAFPQSLPEDIALIRYCNGPEINVELFDAFIDNLIEKFLLAYQQKRIRRWWKWALGTVACVGLSVLIYFAFFHTPPSIPDEDINTPTLTPMTITVGPTATGAAEPTATRSMEMSRNEQFFRYTRDLDVCVRGARVPFIDAITSAQAYLRTVHYGSPVEEKKDQALNVIVEGLSACSDYLSKQQSRYDLCIQWLEEEGLSTREVDIQYAFAAERIKKWKDELYICKYVVSYSDRFDIGKYLRYTEAVEEASISYQDQSLDMLNLTLLDFIGADGALPMVVELVPQLSDQNVSDYMQKRWSDERDVLTERLVLDNDVDALLDAFLLYEGEGDQCSYAYLSYAAGRPDYAMMCIQSLRQVLRDIDDQNFVAYTQSLIAFLEQSVGEKAILPFVLVYSVSDESSFFQAGDIIFSLDGKGIIKDSTFKNSAFGKKQTQLYRFDGEAFILLDELVDYDVETIKTTAFPLLENL